MKSHARVLVIGGGIMGCSLVYHLARAGWRDVVLVEKNELTAGSTWHAAGLCTHYAHDLTVMNLRAYSVRLYSGMLERDTGRPVGFHATGALRVTGNEDRMHEFRHVRGLGRFAGHEFHILSPGELKALYPLVNTDGLLGAIHEPDDGYVDPSQATHAFAGGARDLGVQIHRNNPVTGITRTGGQWVVSTRQGVIRAEHVVNAAGTWCREIGLMMGVDLPVTPMLHQYIVLDRIEAFAALEHELPFIRDPDESWYLRQEGDGVILGPYEKQGQQPWAVDGAPAEFGMELLPPEPERIEGVASLCMARVPAVAGGGVRQIVNGPITFTPDANPLIGPAFGLANAWVLTGSSMGVMEGGGAGRFLARWMLDGEPPEDPLAIDSRRFGGYADRAYRVDKAVECFAAQFGIHYPREERPAGRNKRMTPIHRRLESLGAVFGAVYGWERPNWFARGGQARESELGFHRCNWFEAVAGECRRARDGVVIGDLSVFSKFEVSGPGAAAFMDSLGANAPPGRGRVALCHVLSPSAGVLAEFSVIRLEDTRFYLVGASAAERINQDLLMAHAREFAGVSVHNLTEEKGVLGVMGPRAGALLSDACAADFSQSAFPWLSAQPVQVAGIHCLAVRVSYIGESGWELHCDMPRLEALFAALWRCGQAHDAGLYGAFAMDAMRLEKGYPAWGGDLTSERTPIESGLARFVRVGDRGFTGRDALRARHGKEDTWRMHLLELEDTGQDPFYAHTVLRDDQPVGLVTSGGYGHRVGKPLALAFCRGADAGPLTVEILGRRVDAKILSRPPYDPDNLRMKS